MCDELGQAILDRELFPVYQPILDVRTEMLAGAEALVRWRHRDLGVLQPDCILPIAEIAGLMPDLTYLILEQTIQDWRRLPAYFRSAFVAVNVSPGALLAPGFAGRVAEILLEHRLPADRLMLEIAAVPSLFDSTATKSVLASLRAAGIGLVLDGFGAGYSFLHALRDFPLSKVKLDRAFVTEAHCHEEQRKIMTAMVRLAHDLDLDVVAEGIETKACLDLVSRIGVDFGQGHALTPPMDFEQFQGSCAVEMMLH